LLPRSTRARQISAALRYNESMRASCVAMVLLAAGCRSPPPMLPMVQTPPEQQPPLADVVRTCAFEVSCLRDPPAATMSNCIGYFQAGLDDWIVPAFFTLSIPGSEFRRYVACAVAGIDCTSVLECASRGHDPAFCAAHPGNVCDGDLLVQCPPATASADWAIYTSDCAALGMRCAEANGSASCTDGVGCDPKTSSAYCDGNRYFVRCDSDTSLRYRFDCARSPIVNATCRIDTRFASGCLPSGPPCAGDRCDGDELVVCLAGEEARVDCTGRSSHCAVVSGKPACVPVATDCTYSTSDACDGSGITTCVDGLLERIDCSTLGLTTCMPAPGGYAPICG